MTSDSSKKLVGFRLVDIYVRLEAARDFWQVHRVKQRPNPPKNSSQFAVWWFNLVMRILMTLRRTH
jgi:hypothetical protein